MHLLTLVTYHDINILTWMFCVHEPACYNISNWEQKKQKRFSKEFYEMYI